MKLHDFIHFYCLIIARNKLLNYNFNSILFVLQEFGILKKIWKRIMLIGPRVERKKEMKKNHDREQKKEERGLENY